VLAAFQGAALLPAGSTSPLVVKFRVQRWIASLQYAAHDLDISAEYSRWTGEFDSLAPLIFPPHTVNERYYAMVSYRLASWFTPGVYYSVLYPNVKDRQGRDAYQHDVAATVRYELNAHWVLKLEGHIMRGTAALDNEELNDGKPASALAPDWGVLLVKTTAYF
jgi:predicted porin